MSEIYQAKVNERYKSLCSVYLGKKIIKDGLLEAGQISVTVDYDIPSKEEGKSSDSPTSENDESTSLTILCNLNPDNSIVSGLKKFYSLGVFADGANPYEILNKKNIRFTNKVPKNIAVSPIVETSSSSDVTNNDLEEQEAVFERNRLRHFHIEPFRPENLINWAPTTETDIYMAWGILAEYTGYKYCCGASTDLLRCLGYAASNGVNPDAILINEDSGCYEIAEMKIRSSDFKKNHYKVDVDVLVVWFDDEKDRDILPKNVINLYQKAKDAALAAIMDEE